jgi:hypothetical protein
VLPAIELVYSISTVGSEAVLPAVLTKPLIKVKGTSVGTGRMPAIQSGQRSALIRSGDCVYRLKGCGYWEKGFVLFVHETRKEIRSIRGCQLDDEHLRELRYSEIIARKLGELGYHVNTSCYPGVGSQQACGVLEIFA